MAAARYVIARKANHLAVFPGRLYIELLPSTVIAIDEVAQPVSLAHRLSNETRQKFCALS
jgi:hypothetical protein